MKKEQLPPNAKRVFTGVIFDVYQWEQKMYDGSTTTFERLKRPDTVSVIAAVGDKILFQMQQQPDRAESFPSLPGGRCEGDEDPLAAAKREILEETGYVSDSWKLWKEHRPVSKMIWTIYTFVARNCRYVQPPQLDAGEKITTQQMTFDEFLMLSENPTFSEKELGNILLRARLDSEKREELHKVIFGK